MGNRISERQRLGKQGLSGLLVAGRPNFFSPFLPILRVMEVTGSSRRTEGRIQPLQERSTDAPQHLCLRFVSSHLLLPLPLRPPCPRGHLPPLWHVVLSLSLHRASLGASRPGLDGAGVAYLLNSASRWLLSDIVRSVHAVLDHDAAL